MKLIRFFSALALTLGILTTPLLAQPSNPADRSPDLAVDAEGYARRFGVSREEALRRLELQPKIGALDAWLAENAREIYAGLSIEHQPSHRVVVRFTDKVRGAEKIASSPRKALAAPLEVVTARLSLAQLEALLETTRASLEKSGVLADLTLDVRANRIEVETVDLGLARQALAEEVAEPGSALVLRQVSSLAHPDNPIQGGRPSTTCTTGWVVRNSGSELGVTTAGHCGNTQTYLDDFLGMIFRQEQYGGSYDIQWHSAGCGIVYSNEFDSGLGIRSVTGSLSRSSQAVGAWVCKHGSTTGLTCGSIASKNVNPSYVPSGQSTFIRVNAGDVPLSLPGDSGGPWFSGNTAYGTHSGGNDDNTVAVYMAIDYLSGIGATLQTYNPGSNPPSATVSCTGTWAGSGVVSCTAFPAAGVAPYTVTGWSYYGSPAPASSWSWSGGSANAYFNGGCQTGSYHTFGVTVVDSCGTVGYGQTWFLCQPY